MVNYMQILIIFAFDLMNCSCECVRVGMSKCLLTTHN